MVAEAQPWRWRRERNQFMLNSVLIHVAFQITHFGEFSRVNAWSRPPWRDRRRQRCERLSLKDSYFAARFKMIILCCQLGGWTGYIWIIDYRSALIHPPPSVAIVMIKKSKSHRASPWQPRPTPSERRVRPLTEEDSKQQMTGSYTESSSASKECISFECEQNTQEEFQLTANGQRSRHAPEMEPAKHVRTRAKSTISTTTLYLTMACWDGEFDRGQTNDKTTIFLRPLDLCQAKPPP